MHYESLLFLRSDWMMELECLALLIIGSIVSTLSASPKTRCVRETSDQIDFYTTENGESFTLQSGRMMNKPQVQSVSQSDLDTKTFYGFLTNREESVAHQAIAVSTGVTRQSNFYVGLSTLTEHGKNPMCVLSLELTCDHVKILKFDQYYGRENESHMIQENRTMFNSPFSCRTRSELTILIDYTNKAIRIFDNGVQVGTMKGDLGNFPFNNLEKRISVHGDASVKDVDIYEIDSFNKNGHPISRSDCRTGGLYLRSSDPDGHRRLMSYVELYTSHLGNCSLELIELKKDLNRAFFTNYAVSMHFTPRVSDDTYEIQILDGNENTRLHISVDVEQQKISFQERMHGEKWLESVDVSFNGSLHWKVPVEITVQRLENGYMVYYNGEKVIEYKQWLSIDDRLMLRPSVLFMGDLDNIVISYGYFADHPLLNKLEEMTTVSQLNAASNSPFVMTNTSKDWKQAIIQPPLVENSELLLKIDYADNGGKCYFLVYGDDSKMALKFDIKYTPEYDYMELCLGLPNSKCRHYPDLKLAAKGSQATIKISLRDSNIIFYLNDVILGVHDIEQSLGISKLTHAKSKFCNIQDGYVAVKSDETVKNVEINWFNGSNARMALVPSILLGKYDVSTQKELHLPEPFGHKYLLILNLQDIPRSKEFEIKFKTMMELIYSLKFVSENDKPKLIVEYGTHLESLNLNFNSDTQNKQIVLLNEEHHIVLIVFGQRFDIMKERPSTSPTKLEFDAEKIDIVTFYRLSDSIDSTSSVMQYEFVTMSPNSCHKILVEEGMYSQIQMVEPWTAGRIEVDLPDGLTSLQLLFKKSKSDKRFLFFHIRVVSSMYVEIFAEQKKYTENPEVKRHVEKSNAHPEGDRVSVAIEITNDGKYEIYLNDQRFEIPLDSMDNQYSYLTIDAEKANLCLNNQDDMENDEIGSEEWADPDAI